MFILWGKKGGIEKQHLFAAGELENWWKPETEERFYERIQCIIDQV